jgi:histidinol-phosphate aminotransferase
VIETTLSLARSTVLALKPYSSARSLTTRGAVFLDANENPWGDFNRYPDPQPARLRAALADLYAARSEEIFLGRGTDDAIDALIRTFCEAGRDAVLVCPPTYGVYEVAANLQGARVVEVFTRADEGFEINPEAVLRQITSDVKLVFICSPNNPTGNLTDPSIIESLARQLERRAVIVVDEAYIEFSGQPTCRKKLAQLDNLVVLRTLSKAWGLAAVRCGVAIAHPELIKLLQKVRAPYPISTPSADIAVSALALERRIEVERRTAKIIEARERLALELGRLAFVEKVFPSRANYLLLRVQSASAVLEICRARGIILRDRSEDHGLKDYVRITVGSEEENALLLETLGGVPRVR